MNDRRIFIYRSLLAGSMLIALLARAAKLAKADVQYRDTPKDGKDCDDCMQFVPGATVNAASSCKIVEGPISAHGYCLAFTPKPSATGS
jgi:High potential iron-sulfur protein